MKTACLILVLSFQLYRMTKRMENDRVGLAFASLVEFGAFLWLMNEVW
jgi:hypothetical protein